MKYLDDPFKKVSYSFRIEEKLLEDIKLYSKATGKKLPETFNDLLKESIDGVTVDNTYLKGYDKQLITIPNLIDILYLKRRDNKNRVLRTPLNLLDPELTGFEYVVKKIPNNLDVWIKSTGYTSKNNLLHEGIELVLIPDMLKPSHLDKFSNGYKKENLYKCLVPIYFSISESNQLSIEVINMKEAYTKIKDSNNFELLDYFKANYNGVKEVIDRYLLNMDLHSETQESFYYKGCTQTDKMAFLSEVWLDLTDDLLKNIDPNINVISSLEASIELEEAKNNDDETPDNNINGTSKKKGNKELYNIIKELSNENKKLKNENQSIKEDLVNVTNKINKLDEIITKGINNKELEKLDALLK